MDAYHQRQFNQKLSPDRADAFQLGEQTPAGHLSTYAERVKKADLQRQEQNTMENIAKAQKAAADAAAAAGAAPVIAAAAAAAGGTRKRANRWDQGSTDDQ